MIFAESAGIVVVARASLRGGVAASMKAASRYAWLPSIHANVIHIVILGESGIGVWTSWPTATDSSVKDDVMRRGVHSESCTIVHGITRHCFISHSIPKPCIGGD